MNIYSEKRLLMQHQRLRTSPSLCRHELRALRGCFFHIHGRETTIRRGLEPWRNNYKQMAFKSSSTAGISNWVRTNCTSWKVQSQIATMWQSSVQKNMQTEPISVKAALDGNQ